MGDANKPCEFCSECGKEVDELAISEPCVGKFYVSRVDTVKELK